MSVRSKIEWCDDTWNPWRGCRRVSPGCEHCYAEALVERFHGKGAFAKRVRSGPGTFMAPLKWNEKPWVCDECGAVVAERENAGAGYCRGQEYHRRRVFSLSMGDWLDPEVPVEWLAEMLDVIRRCPNLDFLLLTKRPENFHSRLEDVIHAMPEEWDTDGAIPERDFVQDWWNGTEPPSNVWVGTTVEDQKRADERVPELLKIPAVCRYLSVEPMLEGLDLKLNRCQDCQHVFKLADFIEDKRWGHNCPPFNTRCESFVHNKGIHWVIVGGESGPKARPFNVEWGRSVVRQCREAGVACFVKQLGARAMTNDKGTNDKGMTKILKLKDKKGGDMAEWPEDLRVREFPSFHHRGAEAQRKI